jgi:signal transduction histidine kinase/ActR/RegA family two-component response regulator
MKSAEKTISVEPSRAGAAEPVAASDSAGRGSDERVMVIAPVGADASAIATLLSERGFQCCVCDQPEQVIDEIANAGAVLMTEEALEFPSTSTLLAAFQNQPPWSELPVVILTSSSSQNRDLLDTAAHTAGSVTLLERPIGSDTLVRTIHVALRSRRRQYQVRDLLAEQERNRKSLEESEEKLRGLLSREQGMRQAADEANRLKDEFLATLSHELRNPLNVILGYSELLLRSEDIKQSPHLLRLSEALRRNALAQSYLIRDLLELSRLRSGKLTLNRETVSIVTAINNAIETVRADAAAKQIEIQVETPPEPLFVHGDLLRLEQIVWNLLTNAVKFTPAGGAVSVHVTQADQEIMLVVKDTGQGIEKSFLPKVFEMFRQGDARASREHAGMGIGLALVQQLVRLHEGSVTADSEGPGKGTTITLCLPAKAEGKLPLPRPRKVANAKLDQITVLAVDDDPDTTDLLRYLLEMNGATVITANSGAEALQLAGEQTVDVVLSDISMPSMDGFEFVRRLRSLPGKQDVRIIALTGFGREEDIRQVQKEGFVAHITKPLDVETLLGFVRTLAAQSNHSNHAMLH